MKRLFTFGCSFTQYWRWPTWADVLGRQYDCFENWGVCGAGNALIFNSLIECHRRNSITQNDDVYVMWTNTSREDRYVGNRWLAQGNIYWTAGSEIPLEYVQRFACERGYLIRDLALMSAAQELLQHWGANYRFMSMVPFSSTNLDNGLGSNPVDRVQPDSDVRALYQSVIDIIAPSVYETIFNNNWFSGEGIVDLNDRKRRDFHPTPQEHLRYLDLVFPGLITSDARDWMQQCHDQAKNLKLSWSEPNRPLVRL